MVRRLKDETLFATWKNFFENNYKSELETIALEYPKKRSSIVDYWDIDKFDSDLVELLINQPYKAIFNAEESIKDIDVAALPSDKILSLHFRIKNLPETSKLSIRDKSSQYLGMLISIEGLIRRRTHQDAVKVYLFFLRW